MLRLVELLLLLPNLLVLQRHSWSGHLGLLLVRFHSHFAEREQPDADTGAEHRTAKQLMSKNTLKVLKLKIHRQRSYGSREGHDN